MRLDFTEEFYERLSDSLKKRKDWKDYIHDWVPIFVSVVTLIVFLYVSLFVPYRLEGDLNIEVYRTIELINVDEQ